MDALERRVEEYRLRAEEEWQAAVQAKEDLEETRNQLLLVVAQRDALHAAMDEVRAERVAQVVRVDSTEEVLRREVEAGKRALVQAEQENAVLNAHLGRAKEAEAATGEDLTNLLMMAPHLHAVLPTSLSEKRAALTSMITSFLTRNAALEEHLRQGDCERAALEVKLLSLEKENTDQKSMLEGYHALYRKNQQVPLKKVTVDRDRVGLLEDQLAELREENMKLMEAEAQRVAVERGAQRHEQAKAVSPAVLHSMQLEITRLTSKLTEKKQTIKHLKALLERHLNPSHPSLRTQSPLRLHTTSVSLPTEAPMSRGL